MKNANRNSHPPYIKNKRERDYFFYIGVPVVLCVPLVPVVPVCDMGHRAGQAGGGVPVLVPPLKPVIISVYEISGQVGYILIRKSFLASKQDTCPGTTAGHLSRFLEGGDAE
jgi:hypothetical protein